MNIQLGFFLFDTDQAQTNSVQVNYSNVSNVFLKVFLQKNVLNNL